MVLSKNTEELYLLSRELIELLIAEAIEATKYSHAPYSDFQVGAALLCADDTVMRGCNVENSSYGLTICAERNAIFSAIAQGKKEFRALAVVAAKMKTPVTPCGICRQVLSEFSRDIPVICATMKREYRIHTLDELLPHAFRLDY